MNPAAARSFLAKYGGGLGDGDSDAAQTVADAAPPAFSPAQAAEPYGGLAILDAWATAFPPRESFAAAEDDTDDAVAAGELWADPHDEFWAAA